MKKNRIGERLRILRGRKSREEVGAAIGVTSQAIYNYENGARIPADAIKVKLASYFNRSVQELFFDD